MAKKTYMLQLCLNTSEKGFSDRLIHIVEKHLCNSNFNVNSFSSLMQMSRTQLHRKLKKNTGLSTTAFIRQHRIVLAQLILSSSSLPISKVSLIVGFKDPSYFSQCFKNITGIRPSKYREASKNGQL
ncbi:AraC family transcriptional regulator [Ancylomarina sp. 16SWW S1-10-2]|uniref:helix-turn-helix domain-containing protein n=1 Tax=Ancylomarina sp. 16SWW S1-10-2 TaxID=2499681 RepID=UPI0012ADF3D3|nr:AraC family transcriptional regulator [Ancylomarina sp. 16SWW S1-10-2]MRT93143.1 AraC family transcriptional regulator [Ancylomarina sp. 16SWW S1-10-2]